MVFLQALLIFLPFLAFSCEACKLGLQNRIDQVSTEISRTLADDRFDGEKVAFLLGKYKGLGDALELVDENCEFSLGEEKRP